MRHGHGNVDISLGFLATALVAKLEKSLRIFLTSA